MAYSGKPAVISSALELKNIRLNVFLGVSSEERSQTQAVDLSVKIKWAEPVPACKTDQVADTVCYGTLVEHLRSTIKDKPFAVIERLAHHLFEATQAHVARDCKIAIHVNKLKPPVVDLLGGAHFSYGDFDYDG